MLLIATLDGKDRLDSATGNARMAITGSDLFAGLVLLKVGLVVEWELRLTLPPAETQSSTKSLQ